MRLVIISNMAHYRREDGTIVGHGATARELSVLAQLFDEVRHVACLHDEPAPASARPYEANNIVLVPVPPAGGETLLAKLDIARLTPRYVSTIIRELRYADAVHVRCPANISMYALGILAGMSKPTRRWVKYAGNWQPEGHEPVFYGLQRRLLARPLLRAEVTINGAWPGQPSHVHTLTNPSLTDAELKRGRGAAIRKNLTGTVRLLFVGHLGAAKNPRVAIDTLAVLRETGIEAVLDLAGEGSEIGELRDEVAARGLASYVTLHGPLSRASLDDLYDAAHFVVLPSKTEGWPKVLSEGMASGAVPIATAVGSIPSLLERFGCGRSLSVPPSAAEFSAAIREYVADPARWKREVERGLVAAESFSYSRYLRAVRDLLDLHSSSSSASVRTVNR